MFQYQVLKLAKPVAKELPDVNFGLGIQPITMLVGEKQPRLKPNLILLSLLDLNIVTLLNLIQTT